MAKLFLLVATLIIGVTTAQSAAGSVSTQATLPNWVGPRVGKPIDTACYRKTYVSNKKKQCGAGYNFDNVATCWTQCPIEYPVECGMECIPQNKDCTVQILKKVASVANVALNVASMGLFGKLTKVAKEVKTGVKCGKQLFSVVKKLTAIMNNGTVRTKEQTIADLKKSDSAQYDLPAAVAICMNLPVADGLAKAKRVTDVTDKVLDVVVSSKGKGINMNDFASFMSTTVSTVPGATMLIDSLSKTDKSKLLTLVNSVDTCDADLNSVMNKVISMVLSMRVTDPKSSVDAIKFTVLSSSAVMKDLPKAAGGCATAAKGFSSRDVATTGFPVRDGIIKTAHEMIDNIVGATNKDGKPLSNSEYALVLSNMGLEAIAAIDPTGIAAMAAEFLQPICGPTIFIGDIESGPADQALGLNTIEKAFRGSTGTWSKTGDGLLKITFKSFDDKDVRVNIKSGGQKLYEVPVKKGQTVQWSKPLSEFQGKTLYLNRWRPGLFGLPGTGGGSFLAWVPNNKAGSLVLSVQINPTSFFDWGRHLRG